MHDSCEWVLSNPLRVICLGPSYMGKTIECVMDLLQENLDGRNIYNWGDKVELSTLLMPGMRINFLSDLIRDPKAQRRLKAENN